MRLVFRSALEIVEQRAPGRAGRVAVRYINLAKRNNCQKRKIICRAANPVPESPVLGAAATSFEGCGVGPSDFAFRDSLTDGGTGPDLVTFRLASFPWAAPQAKPMRTKSRAPVTLAKPFAMGLTEVTFDDYDKFAEATGREKPNDGKQGRGALPVINVSYDDATAYTLGSRNRRAPSIDAHRSGMGVCSQGPGYRGALLGCLRL